MYLKIFWAALDLNVGFPHIRLTYRIHTAVENISTKSVFAPSLSVNFTAHKPRDMAQSMVIFTQRPTKPFRWQCNLLRSFFTRPKVAMFFGLNVGLSDISGKLSNQ